MNGKKARALRRAIGYKAGTPRSYHQVLAAMEKKLRLDVEATKKANEPRLKIVEVPKVTLFHQDELRARYRAAKKMITKGEL